MFLDRRPSRMVLASVAWLLVGCGGQPETVDDATVTNPPGSKAPEGPSTPALTPIPTPTPTPTPTATAPVEAKPGG